MPDFPYSKGTDFPAAGVCFALPACGVTDTNTLSTPGTPNQPQTPQIWG